MSTTQACAHVCTTKPVSVIGMDLALGRDRTGVAFIQAISPTDCLKEPTGDRRFWVFDPVALSDVPPPGAITTGHIKLADMSCTTDRNEPSCNYMRLTSVHGTASLTISRHADEYEKRRVPEAIGVWHGYEKRADEAGVEWLKEVRLVANDFGWLVEVPAC